MEFEKAEKEINELEISSPKEAEFIRMELLWWKMITLGTKHSESAFLEQLKSFSKSKKIAKSDNNILLYYIYATRYNNYKGSIIRKVSNMVRFQLFLDQWQASIWTSNNSINQSFNNLILEINSYLKSKVSQKCNPFYRDSNENMNIHLKRIESLHNNSYKSFETIKNYLLAKIYLDIEKNKELAFQKFNDLAIQFPKNTIFNHIIQSDLIEQTRNYQNMSLSQ
ncbi:MAG: hypothetical protein AB7U05_18345 [Mangrovibacterium sp.]